MDDENIFDADRVRATMSFVKLIREFKDRGDSIQVVSTSQIAQMEVLAERQEMGRPALNFEDIQGEVFHRALLLQSSAEELGKKIGAQVAMGFGKGTLILLAIEFLRICLVDFPEGLLNEWEETMEEEIQKYV